MSLHKGSFGGARSMRVLWRGLTAVVAVSAVLLSSSASYASTYGTLVISPTSGFADGDDVTLSYTNLTALSNAGGGFQASICVGDSQPQTGPGSCVPSSVSSTTKYFFDDADGSQTIKVIQGNPGFTDYPNWVCGNANGHHCNFVISDFNGNGPTHIEIEYAQDQTATTTTLNVTPSGPQDTGTSVTLEATVSPSAAGSVQFRDGSADIGSPVTLSGGTASTSTSSLTAGSHTLHAVFIPADDTAYYPSSGSTSYTLTSMTAVDTITSLSVTPSSAPFGTPVTLQADVVRASDNVALTTGDGSVEFYDNGTTSLGSEALGSSGAEVSVSSFTQGSHSITADFVPADLAAYNASTSAPVPFAATAPAAPETGSLVISTTYSAENPFDLGTVTLSEEGTQLTADADLGTVAVPAGGITITDTRSNSQDWICYASASNFTDGRTAGINGQNLSFVDVAKVYSPGSSATTMPVTVNEIPSAGMYAPGATGSDGLKGGPHILATSPGGVGTVAVVGTLRLVAPTSTGAGVYTAQWTFTVV